MTECFDDVLLFINGYFKFYVDLYVSFPYFF